MKLGTARSKETEMGKYYFKACKINKEAISPGGGGEIRAGDWVAAAPPAGRSVAPLGSRVPDPRE